MLAARAESRQGRAWVFAGLALLVLLLHAALLGGIDLAVPARPAAAPTAVQVRRIVAPSPVAPPATATAAARAAPAVARARPRAVPAQPTAPVMAPVLAQANLPSPQAPPPAALPSPSPTIEAPPPKLPPDITPAPSPAAEAASAPTPAAETEAPVYATRMPPPATLRYELQRGRLSGSGELRWRPEGDRYTLQLEGSVVGLTVLTQISQGSLDANGVAPQRFTDQRARRPPQAANFQREAGKISFSGPSTELPLAPGTQDRLSWMIQLAAVAAAEPTRWVAGTRIALPVVGARGDAGVWVFRCLGAEPLELAAGPIATLHWLREPRGPYDTTVEVWLDPARHHLPVRASLRSAAEGDALDLSLLEVVLGF